jgi:large subunit ribosomal protein L14e
VIIMEIGRVCIKTKGREAGQKVVVLSDVKSGKVLVDGEKVKRKECNVLHLFPLKDKVSVGKDAKHEEVVKVLKG